MKKIGLFGGSFDPIHKGHIDIAKEALHQLQLDEIQLIPTQHNPWKDKTNTTVKDRLEMIHLALEDTQNISINTIEIDMQHNDKNFTIDTLKLLKKKYLDVQFYYIMGMDQAILFHKWKDAKKISKMVQLVTFQRGGYQEKDDNLKKYHFILLNNLPIHASSSEARNGHIEMLDPKVLHYITNHGLYLDGLVSIKMKKKRWKHTCSVAKLAKEIAEANGLNGQQAYIAGMFHDVAKEMEYEQSLKIMQEHFSRFVNKPVAIWHQWVSRYVSEHEYLIDDEVILKAIEDHTTASLDISPIGKCVYVADKLDPLRGYDSSNQIRLCKDNIHEGFKESLIDFYKFSKKKNREIDECFYEIYDYFVVKGEI